MLVLLALASTARAEMMVIDDRPVPAPKFPAPPAGPPPQVAVLAKQLAGARPCGAGTATASIALAGAWLQITTPSSLELRTYDVVAKQWTRVVLGGDGTHRTQTSLGDVRGTWTWTGDGVTDEERAGAITCPPAAAARTR